MTWILIRYNLADPFAFALWLIVLAVRQLFALKSSTLNAPAPRCATTMRRRIHNFSAQRICDVQAGRERVRFREQSDGGFHGGLGDTRNEIRTPAKKITRRVVGKKEGHKERRKIRTAQENKINGGASQCGAATELFEALILIIKITHQQ